MSLHEIINNFKRNVAPKKTRVINYPSQILVFGGKADAKFDRHISCRNIFLTKAHEIRHPLSIHLVTPEMFPQWNSFEDGYQNLVDFEIDAGCLSRAILLFVETEGAYAELGAFCMAETLRERLLCVISRRYYEEKDSFIYLGPIKLILKHNEDHSLCVVDNVGIPQDFEGHVEGVLATLQEKIDCENQTEIFCAKRRRDQLLLIADIVDLFCALSFSEILDFLTQMDVILDRFRVKQMLWLLRLFGFVGETQLYGKAYFVAIKGNYNNYLDYDFTHGSGSFDRAAYKIRIFEALKKDSTRYKAYRNYGGK